MRNWLALYSAIFLSVVLLVVLFCALAVPSHAGDVSLDADVVSRSDVWLLAPRLRQARAPGSEASGVLANTSTDLVTPTTQSKFIWYGRATWLRDVDVVLELAPSAYGNVTVTLVPTTPQNPPPGGAISRSWWITTAIPSYEMTATFIYSNVVRDIALVLDKSGSMEWDTLCYGCLEVDAGDYPSGTLHPLPWDGPANGTPQHCTPTQYYSSGGYDYYFIEAEEYSYSNNRYAKDYHRKGYTYWVLQRSLDSASARWRSVDGRGAYIMHMPYPDMEIVDAANGATCRYEQLLMDIDFDGVPDFTCWDGAPGGPYPAPRVDYNFAPVENRPGGYYIWVRGQAMGNVWARSDDLDRRLFWGIDGVIGGSEGRSGDCGVGCESNFFRGTGYDGATGNWEWRRLNDDGPIDWSQGANRTLNIWAGGSEFAVDRIAVTNNPGGFPGDHPPLLENSGQGTEVWANGRSGWACNPCDPRFAGYPSDHPDRPPGFDPSDPVDQFPACDDSDIDPDRRDRRNDDIYDDEQPMRGTVEAFKMFVADLFEPYDQVGYVRYGTNAEIVNHLQCLRRLGTEDCTADVIAGTVITALDSTRAGGATNIAEGMLRGLEVLSAGQQADCESGVGPCGYPNAARLMILMTDGVANRTPNDYCDDDPERQWPGGTAAQHCVIYYAHEARDRNVTINTITLGGGADIDLMAAVADLTGGVYRFTDNPAGLPAVLEGTIEEFLILPRYRGSGASYPYAPLGVEAIYRRDTPTGTWTLHPPTMTRIFTGGWAIADGVTALSEWTVGYLPPHQIGLEADPVALPADGVSTATLTATVTNFYGQPVPNGTVVTFATSLGFFSTTLGTVALPLDVITDTTVGGIATATLTADVEHGQAVVTATAWGMTGTAAVEFVFPFYRVMLEAVPTALPADGTSTAILTATVTDIYGQPVQDGTVITFATSLGSVSTVSGSVSIPFGVTTGGVVTAVLTAGLEPGRAVVTTTAGNATGTTFVEFEPLLPHWVVVEAVPAVLPADGASTSTIVATVTDVYSQPVQDGTVVTFAASLGSLSALTGTTDGGNVMALLTTGLEPGSAVVTATAGDVIGTAAVEFEPLPAYRVVVEAVPDVLSANGISTATLTATVTDIYSHPVQAGTGVTFSTSLGLLSPVSDGTLGTASLPLGTSAEGVVSALLTAGLEPGWAVITATAGGRTGTVRVQFVVSMYLPLVMRGF